ncbi:MULTISPECIES: signal recognition particle-docking protein FtsY [unclassified Rhizobium]|uniref:signal recognition particle-docking protein FtsY n=1 Tax=unclassified Rhizobium TaxID=2613769 RepID=UPI00161CA4F0|nr:MULTISPECIES: signal recognition particle-docking protein FtsY [unclassified Rhizobium]MBB3542760.1 fused signal recognition particle receptor [Rhizobium sp. BK399]MCS3739560.1 fused signal recognition particle receptor [Rhizobium sp. BK661]MCS4091234.1 fused signal recognition particle receptor [Rhizobium sp. BK176]
MAFNFIKKVFTFGPKPEEEQAPEPVETKAVESELEPHSREENLPVAADPVLAEEMDTAGGPAQDVGEDAPIEDLAEQAEALVPVEEDVSEVLPSEMQASDIGVVPLSLLEAETEVVTPAESAPEEAVAVAASLQPGTGEQAKEDDVAQVVYAAETDEPAAELETDADAEQQPITDELSPADQEISAPIEDDAVSDDASAAPVLPKGFATGPVASEAAPLVPAPKLSWFQRLRAGLARTSSQLTGQIAALFTKRKLDDETLQDLEDLLIQADLGVETAMRVTDTLASERYGKDVTGEDVSRIMASEIAKVLKPVAKPLQLDLSHKPHVILVVGVNGTGKTTTIGKLAAKLSGAGLKVMVAAGDTFRAAAIEQLKIWADRTKSEFIGTKLGADAAGLAYDAFEQAKAKKCDVLIIDTAGRLQNKAELMAELEKIVRVLGKLDPDAPHTVLQTLDATTGQNALSQVEIFRNVAGVNGLIMTKLDGTARGGILVAISAKHKLPVYFIGVGEGVDDLEPFEAEDFAHAIAGLGQ